MSETKKVILMRHAKSSWKNEQLKDFDRPLNKRGKRDAPAMGRYLKEKSLFPDQIFSSPAERAKLTILGVLEELSRPQNLITWDENLYFKGASAYLEAIRGADEESELVMTVGHNPMTESMIHKLSGGKSRKPIKTATLAYFEFSVESWSEVKPDSGALKWIIGPKDLG